LVKWRCFNTYNGFERRFASNHSRRFHWGLCPPIAPQRNSGSSVWTSASSRFPFRRWNREALAIMSEQPCLFLSRHGRGASASRICVKPVNTITAPRFSVRGPMHSSRASKFARSSPAIAHEQNQKTFRLRCPRFAAAQHRNHGSPTILCPQSSIHD
jgi:hypothetical protein